MAPPGPQLVHKQFNSPMGLYSQQNIQETLGKHIKSLDNGAVGIDWSAPGAEQPASLANSAVLKLLQEEEREQRQGSGKKKVVWPPTPETNGYHSPGAESQPQHAPPPHQPHYQPPHQAPHQPYQQSPAGLAPSVPEGRRQEQCGLSKLIPVGPGVSPASPRGGTVPAVSRSPVTPRSPASPRSPAANRWAPVAAPQHHTTIQTTFQSPSSPQQAAPSFGRDYGAARVQQQGQAYSEQIVESYSSSSQQGHSAPSHYSHALPPKPEWARSPPPATIPLRSAAPVHQVPPPVYASQPAAYAYKGGVHNRGDAKWPPQSVRQAVEAENDARRALAKGPACRPRKVSKDYSSFFAEHALNHSYTSYRAPPGTQHYDDLSGRSSY